MPSAQMIAAILHQRNFPVAGIFRTVLNELSVLGIEAGGVLEREVEVASEPCRAGLYVVDIRTGETARITQECGTASRGCKLDERGLAAISPRVSEAIEDRADLIVISKFGRAEAEGAGLLSCMAEAICAGIPVLTSVREPYIEPWRAFHGGLGIELAPRTDIVSAWCRRACA